MIIIKRKQIVLIILLIVILLIAGLAVWQWDNIKALYMGITNDENTLAEKRQENDKIITDTLESYPELTVRDLTEEEKKALAEGKITQDDVLLLLQGKTTLEELLKEPLPEPPPQEPVIPEEPKEEEPTVVPPPVTEPDITEPEVTEPTVTPPVTSQPEVTPSADEEISNLVAQMYVLKAEFTTALKNLENTTLKSYAEMSEEEKTAEVKSKMMKQVLDTVANMEQDCDTRVNDILEKLKVLLTESGKDLTLVDSIRTAYNNEKTITKAEYINTYFK